jgi:hypothetical protein
MKKLVLILIILTLVNCKSDKNKSTTDQSAESKTVQNQNFKGKLGENGEPIGIWQYYDETNNLNKLAEYVKINNKSYLNQDWYFDSSGDTIISKSSFYKLILEKESISLFEPLKAKIDLVAPYFKDKYSEAYVVIPKDHSVNFNKDFSNIEEVEKDTIYNLNFKPELKKRLGLKTNWGKTVIFGRYFNGTGKKYLRGILVEFNINDTIETNSKRPNYWTTNKYFEREIIVTE